MKRIIVLLSSLAAVVLAGGACFPLVDSSKQAHDVGPSFLGWGSIA